jgi:hypothetical protein
MKLTAREQEICKKYSSRDSNGCVRCVECPLAISHKHHTCKATVNESEWNEHLNYKKLWEDENINEEQCKPMP